MIRLFQYVMVGLVIATGAIHAKGKTPHDSLPLMVKYQPAVALAQLNKVPFSKRDLTYYYWFISAKENIGSYTEVDSLLDMVFQDKRLQKDSARFIKFLAIGAENNKILDRYEEALTDFNVVLNYNERTHDTIGLIEACLMMAEFYRAADNFALSIEYLNKVNLLGKQLKNGLPPLLRARMLNRKAAVYMEQGKYLDSVERFSFEVIQIGKSLGDLNQVAIASNELGYLYMNLDKKEAVSYFEEALGIWESLGYGIYANNARLNLSRYYFRFGNPKKAIEICNSGLKIIKAEKWDWEEGYTYEVLNKCYWELRNYKMAAYYANLAKEKLLHNASNQYQSRLAYFINKLQLKEKIEEIDKKNLEVMSAQNEVLNKSKENKRLFILLTIVFALLIGSVIGTLIINKQKRQLSVQRKQIDQNVVALNQLVQQKEVLLKEVNHRVKNNLSLLSGLMYLKEKELESEEAINAMRQMQGRINTISLIHEGLYQQSDVERINFSEYLERLTQHIRHIVSTGENVKINIDCGGFNPELQIAIPLAMMMNELMTNSVKHAFKNVTDPEITIQCDYDKAAIVYMDNGPGYQEQAVNQSSLGQRLIYIFAQQIGAEIKHEQVDGFTRKLIILKSMNA